MRLASRLARLEGCLGGITLVGEYDLAALAKLFQLLREPATASFGVRRRRGRLEREGFGGEVVFVPEGEHAQGEGEAILHLHLVIEAVDEDADRPGRPLQHEGDGLAGAAAEQHFRHRRFADGQAEVLLQPLP